MAIVTDSEIMQSLKDVIHIEAQALLDSMQSLDHQYIDAIRLLKNCAGKVVITGIGKSGIVARKIAATMTSTGTLAIFLHPSEALHGDLGVLRPEDVVIAIGKSGESDELNSIFPAMRRIGAKIIAITSNAKSTLAKNSDVVLYCPIKVEACPHDLAPTTSTTLTMALGDALAVTLMKMREFQTKDFAAFHPGGKLGRRLLLKARDLMVPLDKCPILDPKATSIQDVINGLTSGGLGIVLFVSRNQKLHGILTDGDLRNLLNEKKSKIFETDIQEFINQSPFTIDAETMAIDVLKDMEHARSRPINVAPVMDGEKLAGIIRTHELLRVN